MFPRLASSLLTFAALCCGYLGYARHVAPWIDPPRPRRASLAQGITARSTVLARHPELARLFPSDAWELGDPKVVETRHGLLLIQDYSTDDSGRLRLSPCTLVIYGALDDEEKPAEEAEPPAAPDRSPPQPIVLQAPQGAALEFDEAMDLRAGRVGRLLGGQLQGPIRIYRPPSAPGVDDALEIRTRNLQVDAQHIWTPHEVSFRFGPNEGSGQDLKITLLPKSALPGGQPGVGGVKSMELVRLHKMRMQLPAGIWPEQLKALEAKAVYPEPAAPKHEFVEVTCQGPLEFDFTEMVASFEDRVKVARLAETGPSDTLDCHRLEAHFASNAKIARWTGAEAVEAAEASPAAPARDDMKAAPRDKLSMVRRVVALGSPVVLHAPSIPAAAQGRRFECDLEARRVRLDSAAPGEPVWLQYQDHEITVPKFEYQWEDIKTLGQLWMPGPGRILAIAPDKPSTASPGPRRLGAAERRATMELTFSREARLTPDQGMHVASLAGSAKAVAVSPDGQRTEIGADELYVWLRPDKKDKLAADRLLALGVVRIFSPQATGSAGRVEVWFVDAPPDRVASDPGARPLPLPGAGEDRSATLDVAANLVRVQMLRSGDAMRLDEATLEGAVQVTAFAPQAGDEPLTLKGNLVRIEHGPAPQAASAVVRVFGHPAEATGSGVAMYGTNLQLDRGAGKFWIVGAGKMTFALQRLLADRMPEKDAGSLPASAEVIWQHGLHFDGSVARMTGGIEARTDQQRLRAGSLDVTFNRPIDFQAMRLPRGAQPATLRFDGGVFAESYFWKEGQLEAIDQAQTANLVINVTDRAMAGDGPGWVRSIRRGRGDLAQAGGAAPSAGKAESHSLIAAHIDFELGVVGRAYDERLSQWDLRLLDRVQAGYRPAASWEDRLMSSDPLAVGPKGMTLTCREFVIAEMGEPIGGVRQIEAFAIGDTRIEGGMYVTTADRLSYSLALDRFVLEGDGRADARLETRASRDMPAAEAIARKIIFWRSKNEFEVDEGKYFGAEQIGRTPSRSRLR